MACGLYTHATKFQGLYSLSLTDAHAWCPLKAKLVGAVHTVVVCVSSSGSDVERCVIIRKLLDCFHHTSGIQMPVGNSNMLGSY